MADIVQPQGYSSTDAATAPLPDDSPKLQQFRQLKEQIGKQVQVRRFIGHTDKPEYCEIKANLVDVLLVPTSPPVYRWLHDEMWTIKLRVQKADGELSELVVDRTTQIDFVA